MQKLGQSCNIGIYVYNHYCLFPCTGRQYPHNLPEPILATTSNTKSVQIEDHLEMP